MSDSYVLRDRVGSTSDHRPYSTNWGPWWTTSNVSDDAAMGSAMHCIMLIKSVYDAFDII